MGGAVLALVGFGFSAYLTWLELFEIDAICQWCVASAVLMTALALIDGAERVAPGRATPPVRPRLTAAAAQRARHHEADARALVVDRAGLVVDQAAPLGVGHEASSG